MCTSTWLNCASTTNYSIKQPEHWSSKQKAKVKQSSDWTFGFKLFKFVEHNGTVKDPQVSGLSWRFRSFYFSNNWEMLNTEQIKMPPVKTPENRFLSTSCSTFPLLPAALLCSFLIVCSFTLSRSVCTKSNRNGAYTSVMSGRGVCNSRTDAQLHGQACFLRKANPDLPRHIGRDEWLKEWMGRGCAEANLNLSHVRKSCNDWCV